LQISFKFYHLRKILLSNHLGVGQLGLIHNCVPRQLEK
jgi:hypothetical protein